MLLFPSVVDSFQRLSQLFLFTAEREPDIAFACIAENKSGRDKYVGFTEHTIRQCFAAHFPIGYPSPEEHTNLLLVVCAIQRLHDLSGQFATTTIDAVHLSVPCRRCVQRFDLKGLRVELTLEGLI